MYNLKVNSNKKSATYSIAKLIINSLAGKFGTDPVSDRHAIIESSKAKYYEDKYTITNVIDLGNNKELISYFSPNSTTKESNKPSSKNTSIAIALAITAYSRIQMAHLKKIAQESGLTIYYMDTDCIAISGDFDPNYIGTELGKLKLEHVFNEVVYLAPKVYAGKTDSYEYVKIKGAKNSISLNEMKKALFKNEILNINHFKNYKNVGKGYIEVKNEIYTLMLTDNKRKLIFSKDNKFINTVPYVLDNENIINK